MTPTVLEVNKFSYVYAGANDDNIRSKIITLSPVEQGHCGKGTRNSPAAAKAQSSARNPG